jgi:predicted NUDIX family phosphoesterase
MSEQVMVVERHLLAPFLIEYGLVTEGVDEMFETMQERHFFIDRPTAEISPQYKQIIPYVVIRNRERYFLLQRTPKQTETRLHHKMSIGIGGHINPDTPGILDGLQKELEEEVEIAGDYDLSFIGILNDDTTDVGRVHLGAVYLLEVHTPDVRVRETEKMTGRWATADELQAVRASMESWSQIVFDASIRKA